MSRDDLQRSLTALASAGTRKDARLPATSAAPAIPERSGASAPIVVASSAGGGSDLTLKGPKIFTSTDGFITLSFPESAEAVIGEITIIMPAIVKTP